MAISTDEWFLRGRNLASLIRRFQPSAYLRCTRLAHRVIPLGMGYGMTCFASSTNGFQLLYMAKGLSTSMAQAVVRDRFGAR
ncbi:hypothetical protein [Sphingobium sp. 15-1]|uniref:hypothetical protein n=1 Tax=Sphingobium sp. 15-1 TaxID=2729616 RepID=UPI00159C15EC|nr:hypothetical protein [Sphingobium sp. 15-1]